MTYRPVQNKKTTYTISGALMLCGAVCLMSAQISFSIALMQLLGIACFTSGIFILIRYALQEFIYTVDCENGSYDLSVNKVYGKRSQMVCKLALSSCVAFEKKTADFDYAKHGKITRRYNYCGNFAPKTQYLFFFREEEGTELQLITLECDGAFVNEIAQRLPDGCNINI